MVRLVNAKERGFQCFKHDSNALFGAFKINVSRGILFFDKRVETFNLMIQLTFVCERWEETARRTESDSNACL